MLSETMPGRAAQAWRFPARNRVIAALVSMVVVVESHARGGSLITAEAAIARGIDVRVVPGPVHSPASAGSNQLLYDGPGPVRSAQDVLDGLGIFLPADVGRSGAAESTTARPGVRDGLGRSAAGGSRSHEKSRADGLSPEAKTILDAVSWRPTSLSQLVDRSGLALGAAAEALDRLELLGMVRRSGQWWVRRSHQ
jgi:DNA processing protein